MVNSRTFLKINFPSGCEYYDNLHQSLSLSLPYSKYSKKVAFIVTEILSDEKKLVFILIEQSEYRK